VKKKEVLRVDLSQGEAKGVTHEEKSATMPDEEWAKIPMVKEMNRGLKLLETLKELHGDEMFAEIRLTTVAEHFSAKIGENYSSLKVAALIRNVVGEVAMLKRRSRYYTCANIDTLNRLLKQYEKWRV
jgi:hypothetical protein